MSPPAMLVENTPLVIKWIFGGTAVTMRRGMTKVPRLNADQSPMAGIWTQPPPWPGGFPSPHDEGVGRGLGRGAPSLSRGCIDKPLSPLVPREEREPARALWS